MKCHTNVISTPPTQLPHKFSYTVAIFIHNLLDHPILLLFHFYLIKIERIDEKYCV
jgi:hypothetical protein